MPRISGTAPRRDYVGGFDVSPLTQRFSPLDETLAGLAKFRTGPAGRYGAAAPDVAQVGEGDEASGVTAPRPLSELLDEFDARHAEAFGGALKNAARYNPDEVAQKDGLRRRTGAPIADLMPDKNGAERVAQAESFSREQIDAFRKDRPAFFKRVMADPAFAAMVSDHVEQAAEMEGLWPLVKNLLPLPMTRKDAEYLGEFGKDLGRGYRRGQVQFAQGTLGNKQLQHAFETGTYDEGIADTLRSMDAELEALQSGTERGFFAGAPEVIAEQATNLAGGIAARGLGLVGGPVGVGAAGFAHGAATESGHAMVEFSRMTDDTGERVDPRIAAGFATAAGAINGVLETVAAGTVLRALPGGNKLGAGAVRIGLGRILANRARAQALWKVIEPQVTAFLTEGSTEAAQELVNIVAGELAKDASFEGYDFNPLTPENVARAVDAAKAGAQASLIGLPGVVTRAVAPGQGQNTEARMTQGSPETARTNTTNRTDAGPSLPSGEPAGPGDAADTSVNPVTGEALDGNESLEAATSALVGLVEEAGVSERDAVFLEKLGEWVSKAAIVKRSPEATAEYVQEAVGRLGEGLETVRIAETAVRAAVDGKPEVAMEFRRAVPDFDVQMRQASEVGGDILIPTGAYAAYIAPGAAGKAVAEHVKLRPGAMSRADLAEQGPALHAEMTRLLERNVAETQAEVEADALFAELVQQRAGEMKAVGNAAVKKQAEAGAALEVAMVRHLGRRAGLGVRAAWERFRARFTVRVGDHAPGNVPRSIDDVDAHESMHALLGDGGVRLEQIAYHGSPHTFEKFSTEKIGTGEGAQAFGHGLYFASNEAVAKAYKDAFTRTEIVSPEGHVESTSTINPYSEWSDVPYQTAEYIERAGSFEGAREKVLAKKKNNIAELNPEEADEQNIILDAVLDRIDFFEKNGWKVNRIKGRKYTVDLAPAEDEYLLWDKPLSEQSEKVKAALKPFRDDPKFDLPPESDVETGATAYARISGDIDDQAEASRALRAAGIRGIKYLDGSSRWKGEGDYNYVIFDDRDVTITRLEQVVDQPGDVAEANRVIGEMPAEELARYLESFKGGRQGTLARTWLEARTGKRDIDEVPDAAADVVPARGPDASAELFGVGNDAGYNTLDDAAPGQTGMLFQDANEPERTIAGVYGESTEVKIEGVEPYKARYKVVEVGDLVPSHDFTSGSGQPNEAYPRSLQPRNLNDNASQVGRILSMGRAWQPGDANSTSEFAQTGPPTVSPEGYVINGNGRVGAAQLAAAEGGFAKNKEFLLRAAALFGLDPVAIANMQAPILVREMEFSGKSAEAMRFAAQGNVSITGSESPVREAHRLNRTMKVDLLPLLDLDARTTREAVSDKAVNEEIRDMLRTHLPASEQAKFLTPEGELTEIGVELVENMVLTQYLPVGIVERLRAPGNRKALLNTIESAIPTLNKIARASSEMPGAKPVDLRPTLVASLDYLSGNPGVTLDAEGNLPENLDMFAEQLGPEVRMMTKALLGVGTKPKVFRDKLREFGYDMEGGLGMEPREPMEAFAERFGVEAAEGAQFKEGVVYEPSAELERKTAAAATKRQARQIRGSYSPKLREIALTPKANFSTFVHELAHWYLFSLNEVAQGAMSPEAMQDITAVLGWVGADSVQGMTREQHEQFANGFLKYLQDGKIPEGVSAQIKRAFVNFRNWLLGLWRSQKLQALEGIELSEEVRTVFDRMLAGDAAVDEARHQAGARALYPTRNDANMTEAEFAQYLADAQGIVEDAQARMDEATLRAQANRETRDYRERVARHMKSVRAEFERRRDWRARKAITKDMKLDETAVHEILGRDEAGKKLIKQMPFGAHGMTKKTGGLDPDEVAAQFGYTSGEQMLRDIIPLTEVEMKRRVKTEAENRVDDEAPLPPKEKLDEDAMVAVANRKLENVILAEDAALSRELGDAPIDTKRMRAVAKGAIAEMPVGSISPRKHVREMQYQQRKALKGVQKGDAAMVREARRRQLMQKYLFDEAMEAQREINKILRDTARYRKGTLRKRLALAGSSTVGASSYIDQIDAILNRMQLSQAAAPQGIESLGQFLKREEANGKPVRVDEDVAGRSVPWRSLDLDGFRAVHDALKNIEKMGVLEGELRLGARQETVEQARNTTRDALRQNLPRQDVTVTGKEGIRRRVKDRMLNFHTRLRRMSNIWRVADGFNDNGQLWQLWKQPADEAIAAEYSLQRDMHGKLLKIWEPYTTRKLRQKVNIPNTDHALTKAEVMALALNWGNVANRQRVLELGEAAPGVSVHTIDAIFDTMSKQDWDTVQATWDLLDELWPRIQANEVETTGVHPRRVEPSKVTTKHGDYSGGYYPIKYDADTAGKTMEFETDAELATALQQMGNMARAQTRQGHTKARTGSGGQKLRLDLNVIPEHINQVVHDVTHRKVVMGYVRLLRDPLTDQALREYLPGGPSAVAELRRWVGRVAGSDRIPTEVEERILGHLRRGTVASRIGLKATVIGQQIFGLGNSAARVGAVRMASAIGDLLGDFGTGQIGNKYRAVMQASEFMRNRSETFSRDATEAMQRRGKSKVLRAIDAAMFGSIGKMQLAVDIPTWLAGYNKAVDENPEIAHEDAVAVADRLVKESQGGGLRTDLSAIEDTNNEFKRLFTSLYSYFNVVYNLTADNAARVRLQRDPAAAGKAVGDFLWIVTMQATLAQLAVGRGPDDDEGWLEWILKEHLQFMAGSVPYLRDIVSGLEYGKTEPAGSPFGTFVKAGSQIAQGELDRPLMHSGIDLAGMLTHLPSGQLNTFLRGLEDIQDGKTGGFEAAVNLVVPLQRVKNRENDEGVEEGVYTEAGVE